MANFNPRVHDVILHPADAANTPLQSDVWDDEDFQDEDEEDEEEAETAARAAEAESREREERENRLKEWVSRHPGWELVRVDGKLMHRKIEPRLKIPPSYVTPAEIRAEISTLVRKKIVPALAEKYLPVRSPPAKQKRKPSSIGENS